MMVKLGTKGLFLLGSSTPREGLPFNSSLGIAIPTLGNHPSASGGSGEGGRGIGEENLKLVGAREAPSNLAGKELFLLESGLTTS